MKDFAYWLRVGRERAGLNQAQLASKVDQSSSYISMLESRKKPPPSDEVVRKLALALDIEEERLLEVAHIERTPPDIQRKVIDLGHALAAQNQSRKTLLDRVLPAALYPLLARPAFDASALPLPRSTLERFERFAEPLRGILDYEAFSPLAVRAFEALADDEREAILDAVGELAGAVPRHAPARGTGARLPIFLDIPERPVAESLEDASGSIEVPPAEASPRRYGGAITGNDYFPKIEHGDLVILDEARRPVSGDLVAVIHRGKGALMRHLVLAGHVELSALSPNHPPITWRTDEPPADLAIRGVALRTIRDLG